MLAGRRTVFMTSAPDAAVIHSNHTDFNRDEFLRDIAASFGVSKHGVWQLWHKPSANTDGEALAHRLLNTVRRELSFKSSSDDSLQGAILRQQKILSTWEHLELSKSSEEDSCCKISLSRWCRDTVAQTSLYTLFGKTLLERHPDILGDFYAFEDRSWRVIHNVPTLPFSKLAGHLKRTRDTFEDYFSIPQDQRIHDMSTMVARMETMMQDEGLDVKDIGSFLGLIHWA